MVVKSLLNLHKTCLTVVFGEVELSPMCRQSARLQHTPHDLSITPECSTDPHLMDERSELVQFRQVWACSLTDDDLTDLVNFRLTVHDAAIFWRVCLVCSRTLYPLAPLGFLNTPLRLKFGKAFSITIISQVILTSSTANMVTTCKTK